MDNNHDWLILDEVHSTNTYLKEWMNQEELKEGSVVVAHSQTAGRGQMGTLWESQAGKNLTFSIVLYPTFLPLNQRFLISQLVSLAIKEMLDSYVTDFSIKWPNDIYWQEKKIAGILIENTIEEDRLKSTVIGIGLNVNQEQFHSDAPNPVSLKQITGLEFNIEELLLLLLEKISFYYHQIQEMSGDVIVSKYKQSLFRSDGYYVYSDTLGYFQARIADVEGDGRIVLEDDQDMIRKYGFKEVKIENLK